jgi:NAD(P)-dependent dehydrogenase (short-subunit alcohol dehydrogenase family)
MGPGLRRLDLTVEMSPPLGRLGAVDEVAAAALFLTSDDAYHVSVHTLAVAGGRRGVGDKPLATLLR